ncbi:hypothetical protein IHE45_17G020900 [Dioscorea alata]|uniref:Uncharacterized protein n=1 Tax=Dioscorea alata TaxID=55571 RepID=A0ACB7UAZ1_DIOAL|nr:hypothetical protein IHE45_17G020900 [Dioscorea alata]
MARSYKGILMTIIMIIFVLLFTNSIFCSGSSSHSPRRLRTYPTPVSGSPTPDFPHGQIGH